MKKEILLLAGVLLFVPSVSFAKGRSAAVQEEIDRIANETAQEENEPQPSTEKKQRPSWAMLGLSFTTDEASSFINDSSKIPIRNGYFFEGEGYSLNMAKLDAATGLIGFFATTNLQSTLTEYEDQTYIYETIAKNTAPDISEYVKTIDTYTDSNGRVYVLMFLSELDIKKILQQGDELPQIEIIYTTADENGNKTFNQEIRVVY